MKYIKLITVLTLLFCAFTSYAQRNKVKGNGTITTITRSTGDYNGIKVAGPMNFKLIEGTTGKITIKGDTNLMTYIITEVKGGKLIVKTKNGINLRPSKTIVVTMPYNTINHVTLSGSGDIDNSGTIKSSDLKIILTGSGDIKLNIDATSVESSIAGSGDIQLKGSSNNLKARIAGSGDFYGSSLNSKNVTVNISGSGDANIVCNGQLKVRISGSGDVNYSGIPTSKDAKISGSGSVGH